MSVKNMVKLFNQLQRYHDLYSVFNDFLEMSAIAISNSCDLTKKKQRESDYKKIIKQYTKDEQLIFPQILAELVRTMEHIQFGDVLGELFMQFELGSKWKGQFFTPYSVSKACAEVAVDAKIVKKKMKKREVLVISEPTSGSGGMILATIDVLWNKYHFNYTENCFVEASDIDSRCVHMCYIQLSLAGVPAIVKQQDALTRELFDVWYTPAYLFQYLRFREFEKCAHM